MSDTRTKMAGDVKLTKRELEWTKAEEAKLKQLWEVQGKSATQVGRIFNRTKNSIIGKVHRMKLVKRKPKAVKVAIRAIKAATPKGNNGAAGKSRGMIEAVRKAREEQVKPPNFPQPASRYLLTGSRWGALPGTTPYSLEDLPRDGCRWPIGHAPPYAFCGCKAQDKSSYCAAHKARAYYPGTPSEKSAIKSARSVVKKERRIEEPA